MYTYSMHPNIDIMTYSDYRTYLRDYYSAAKQQIPGFTFETWAHKAGFASASFIKLVIEGKRDLTISSATRIAHSVGLRGKTATFFLNLVKYNNARTLTDKIRRQAVLKKSRTPNDPRLLNSDEYRYIETCHNPLIAEMTELPDFEESVEWIARRSAIPLRRKEIAAALEFMLTAGYLLRDNDGRLRKKDRTIRAASAPKDEAMGLVIRNYHAIMLQHAQKAVALLPLAERHITDTMLSLSKTGYEQAVERIRALRDELLAIARADDKDATGIYNLNLVFFPLTNSVSQTSVKKRTTR
jgi:uncharacterized protein (TIGR02147 family)